MISYIDALDTIRGTASLLPAVTRPLGEAAGTVAATPVYSRQQVPPFDNSAVDGFALSSSDTGDAAAAQTIELQVTDLLTAGQSGANLRIDSGNCCEIMTGAPVPAGCDTVVPLEQVEINRAPDSKPLSIRLTGPVAAGRNLRKAGEDFEQGALLLQTGQLINAECIMGLAANGTTEVEVRNAPRVVAITTGNELSTGKALRPGMINDSNGPYLAAALPAAGAKLVGLFRSSDSADELIAHINTQSATDIVVTTGGVSAGRMDFVPAALEQLGADILFHKAAIRPGKPLLFARLPDGRLVFGLPGNPIAVAVGLRFFVVPALRAMQGLPPETFPVGELTAAVHKKPGLQFFAKAHATIDDTGRLFVRVLPGQESFKISPLMQANCWAMADAAADHLDAGQPVAIAPLRPGGLL